MTHPQRCETCNFNYQREGLKCPYDNEDVYYRLKEEMRLPAGSWLFTSIVGCASHSDAGKEREKVLDELTIWMKGRYDLPALKEKLAELRQGKEER